MNTTASTSPADMEQLHVWTARYFASAKQLPVAFNLGGKAIAGFPDRWQATTRRQRIEANLVETVYEGTDPVTGLRLRVEVTEYQDYPVVEWVAWLTNMGTAPTPPSRATRRCSTIATATTAAPRATPPSTRPSPRATRSASRRKAGTPATARGRTSGCCSRRVE